MAGDWLDLVSSRRLLLLSAFLGQDDQTDARADRQSCNPPADKVLVHVLHFEPPTADSWSFTTMMTHYRERTMNLR